MHNSRLQPAQSSYRSEEIGNCTTKILTRPQSLSPKNNIQTIPQQRSLKPAVGHAHTILSHQTAMAFFSSNAHPPQTPSPPTPVHTAPISLIKPTQYRPQQLASEPSTSPPSPYPPPSPSPESITPSLHHQTNPSQPNEPRVPGQTRPSYHPPAPRHN